MSQALFPERLTRLRAAAAEAALDAVVIVPGPNLAYLTGLNFHLSERPTMLLIPTSETARPWFLVPALEATKADGLPFTAERFDWSDDDGPEEALQRAVAASQGVARLGVEGRRIRWLELDALKRAGLRAEIHGADAVFAALRMRKGADEIAHMRAAVAIAETAFQTMLGTIRAGMTEREVAAELMLQLLRGGTEGMPFSPIVATGEHGANPHAVPEDRPLQPGDLVTVDWGAIVAGYASDITRCLHVAGAPLHPDLAKAHQVVLAANTAGRQTARPGTTGDAVDRAARAVIADAGLGAYFIHRTGHGLGLETHEEPDMKAGETIPLAEGMTFTVEPGVYVPGLGGCRIEDDMVITASGAESLTTLPREPAVVG